MAKVMLFGYFGAGNFGDEWMLASFLNECQRLGYHHRIFSILTRDPKRTYQEHGITSIPRRWKSIMNALRGCEVLVGCGGSLLQDSTSLRSLVFYSLLIWYAKSVGKRVALIGQGIGPLKRKISLYLAQSVLEKCDLITFRDHESLMLAQKLTDRVNQNLLCADLTFLHKGLPIWRPQFRIAINLRPATETEKIRFSVVEALKEFIGGKSLVLLLPLQTSIDEIALQPLEKKLPCHWWRNDHWLMALDGISRSNFVIAMRLHALIACCLIGVPFIALSYDPKVTSILKGALPENVLSLNATSDELLKVLGKTEENWKNDLLYCVQAFVNEQRALARRNLDLLQQILPQSG